MGRGPAVKLDEQGRKRCPKCKTPKKLEEFGGSTDTGWWRTSWCRTCLCKHKKEKYRANHNGAKEKALAWHRNNTYGIDDDTYQMMVFMQGGVCAICGQSQRAKNTNELCIDHNHVTGQVRGLLCQTCNMLTGFIEKDRERVKKAVKYLKMHDM